MMMNIKCLFFSVLAVLFFTSAFSQRKLPPDSYNRLGVRGGLNYFTISDEDFGFKPGAGLSVGLGTRATAGKKLLFLYGINFIKFNTSLEVLEENTLEPTEINFKGSGVQINFFVGHKLIGNYLTIEGGPVVQFNGKLAPEEGAEEYRLVEYDLVAKDLESVSKLNINASAGLSAGLPWLRLWVQYQYGLSNMLGDLDLNALREKDPAITSLRGKMTMAMAGIVFYF